MLNTFFCVHSSAYEEGKFCETFHLNASGWRCCESCGKVREIFKYLVFVGLSCRILDLLLKSVVLTWD